MPLRSPDDQGRDKGRDGSSARMGVGLEMQVPWGAACMACNRRGPGRHTRLRWCCGISLPMGGRDVGLSCTYVTPRSQNRQWWVPSVEKSPWVYRGWWSSTVCVVKQPGQARPGSHQTRFAMRLALFGVAACYECGQAIRRRRNWEDRRSGSKPSQSQLRVLCCDYMHRRHQVFSRVRAAGLVGSPTCDMPGSTPDGGGPGGQTAVVAD